MEEITVVSFVQSESPNITERLRLKRNLGCRNFHWYLTTVYPELYIPQDRPALSGEVAHTHTTHSICTTHWQSWQTDVSHLCLLKLYNVGTGSCADYPRGQGLQGGAMSITPCSGTGSQVTMTTVVKSGRKTGKHTVAKMISLVIAALRFKLWVWSAVGSHGSFVFGRQGTEGGFISVSQTPTNHQHPPVEVYKGKAWNETFFVDYPNRCLRSQWANSVCLLSASAERSTCSPAVPVVSWSCKGGRAPTKQPKRSQQPDRRSLSAPLHPSPQTTVAFWATSSS